MRLDALWLTALLCTVIATVRRLRNRTHHRSVLRRTYTLQTYIGSVRDAPEEAVLWGLVGVVWPGRVSALRLLFDRLHRCADAFVWGVQHDLTRGASALELYFYAPDALSLWACVAPLMGFEAVREADVGFVPQMVSAELIDASGGTGGIDVYHIQSPTRGCCVRSVNGRYVLKNTYEFVLRPAAHADARRRRHDRASQLAFERLARGAGSSVPLLFRDWRISACVAQKIQKGRIGLYYSGVPSRAVLTSARCPPDWRRALARLRLGQTLLDVGYDIDASERIVTFCVYGASLSRN